MRYTVGGALLVAIAAANGQLTAVAALPLAGWGWIVASVVTALIVGDTSMLLATKRVGVSRALPIGAVYPVIATGLSGLLLGEPVGWRLAAGAVLVAWGTGQLGRSARSAGGGSSLAGIVLALLAAVGWASAAIAGRQALHYLDPLPTNALRLPLAALVLLTLLPYWRRKTPANAPEWPHGPWLALGCLVGALATVGSLGFYIGVEYIGVAKSVIIQASGPVLSLPFAALLLGETIRGRTLVGVAATTLGVLVVLL